VVHARTDALLARESRQLVTEGTGRVAVERPDRELLAERFERFAAA
jgi:hypothetical protein